MVQCNIILAHGLIHTTIMNSLVSKYYNLLLFKRQHCQKHIYNELLDKSLYKINNYND
jgi:hypothetical protein